MKGQLGSKKSYKRSAMESEEGVARVVGGVRVRGSGCSERHKGDVRRDDMLIEVKETDNKAFLLTQTILSKICKESRESGRRPAVVIKFNRTPLGTPREWILLPLNDLEHVGITRKS